MSDLLSCSRNWFLIKIWIFVEGGRRRQWHPTSVLLPGKSHGQRSLVGYSPWGLEESDMTERLPFHFPLSYIGEGNGSPLQCSCLENPRDRGAWWAAVSGVTQSRTRLKWLSSLFSSIRSQTEEVRTLISQPPEQKPQSQKANQNDHMVHSLVTVKGLV